MLSQPLETGGRIRSVGVLLVQCKGGGRPPGWEAASVDSGSSTTTVLRGRLGGPSVDIYGGKSGEDTSEGPVRLAFAGSCRLG